MKKIKKFLLGILSTIILLGVIGAVLSANIDKNNKQSDVSSKPENSTSKAENLKEKEDNNKTDSEQNNDVQYISMNKFGKITEDVSLKVNKATKKDKISTYNGTMYGTPQDENGIFLIVNITLKNNGKRSAGLNYLYFTLMGADEEKYSPTTVVGADENFLILDAINPKMKETGNLAFQVPKNTKIKKCKLCYNSGGIFEDDIYFNLK